MKNMAIICLIFSAVISVGCPAGITTFLVADAYAAGAKLPPKKKPAAGTKTVYKAPAKKPSFKKKSENKISIKKITSSQNKSLKPKTTNTQTKKSLRPKEKTTVIGRVKDLKRLKANEQSLLKKLPDKGSPKANWKQNSGVLRQEMAKGRPIKDKSPGDKAGKFLNAERNLLRNHGWRFDAKTNFWLPPPKKRDN